MIWSNDTGDWVFYLVRLKWIFLIVALSGFLNLALLGRGSKTNILRRFTGMTPWLCVATVALAVVALNAREDWLLTLLGSEDDKTAERAYYAYAIKARPDKLISLLRSNREDDNVRYYLCRMIGETLRNVPAQQRDALLAITNAPTLVPRFISENRVNKDAAKFSTPIQVQTVIAYYASQHRGDLTSRQESSGVTVTV